MSYLTKAELTKDAEALGLEVDPTWTREQIQEAIDEATAAEPGAVEAPAAGLGNNENLGFPAQPGEAPAG